MSKYLYEIIREIKLIVRRWDLDLTPEKVKVYQDDMRRIENLTWSEYLNTLCDSRAKELIKGENRTEIEFPFVLLSRYVTSANYEIVLNDKDSIEIAISLATSDSYVQSKFRSNFRLNQID